MENTGSPSCSPGGGKSSPACSGNPVGGTISGRIRAGFCGNDGANRCRAIDEKRSGDPPVRGNAAPTHTPGTHPAGHQQLSVPLSLRLVDGTGRILRNHSGNTVPPAGPPPGDNGPGRNGRPEDEGVFINDDKEIREHEIVAGSILSRLSPFGSVTRTARSVLNLGTLIHFVTYLTLESDEQHTPAHWIRLLHPTPALGSQPRTENTLAQLDDWRSRLRCPLHFGAPFGFLEDGDFFCLVGIRSLYWQGQRLALCTGGGVVASSTLTHEWRELKLKRDTVRRSFHLP